MVRTQLYLPEDLHARLRATARERRTTISELVREALEERYAEGVAAEQWHGAVDGVVGAWSDRQDLPEDWAREVRRSRRRLDRAGR